MDQTRPVTGRRRRLTSPPPPWTPVEGRLPWSLCLINSMFSPILYILNDLYDSATTFHRVLILELVSVLSAIQLMPVTKPDPLLSLILEMIKIGLVGDCIYAVAAQLRRRSEKNLMLRSLLSKATLLFGSSTEVALTLLLLRQSKVPAAERVLVGSVYAKVLVMGAVCLISRRFGPAQSALSMHTADCSDVFRLLMVGGMLILSSAPHILSRSRPLLFFLYSRADHNCRRERLGRQRRPSVPYPPRGLHVLLCLSTKLHTERTKTPKGRSESVEPPPRRRTWYGRDDYLDFHALCSPHCSRPPSTAPVHTSPRSRDARFGRHSHLFRCALPCRSTHGSISKYWTGFRRRSRRTMDECPSICTVDLLLPSAAYGSGRIQCRPLRRPCRPGRHSPSKRCLAPGARRVK